MTEDRKYQVRIYFLTVLREAVMDIIVTCNFDDSPIHQQGLLHALGHRVLLV